MFTQRSMNENEEMEEKLMCMRGLRTNSHFHCDALNQRLDPIYVLQYNQSVLFCLHAKLNRTLESPFETYKFDIEFFFLIFHEIFVYFWVSFVYRLLLMFAHTLTLWLVVVVFFLVYPISTHFCCYCYFYTFILLNVRYDSQSSCHFHM